MTVTNENNTRAVLSQGEPRDAALNFDTHRILQLHRAVTAVNLSQADMQ